MFNMMKSKINYLEEHKYSVENRLETECQPMTEDMMNVYN